MFLSTSSVFHKFNNNPSKNQPFHHNYFLPVHIFSSLLSTATTQLYLFRLHFVLYLAIISKTKIKYEIKYHIETKSLNGGTVEHTNVAFFFNKHICFTFIFLLSSAVFHFSLKAGQSSNSSNNNNNIKE